MWLLASTVLVVANACGPPARSTPTSVVPFRSALDRIRERNELRVGTTGDYKPFSFRDPVTGDYEGIDIDMAHSLASALGVRLRLIATSWPTLMRDLLVDRFDLAMGGITITPARRKTALFSAAYLRDGKSAIARCSERERFPDLPAIDREGVRVIVNPGGTNFEFVQGRFHRATVTVFSDNTRIPEELVAGRADVMVTDQVEIALQTKMHHELCQVGGSEPFAIGEKGYLLPRNQPSLLAFVNRWLREALAREIFARTYHRWLEHYGQARVESDGDRP
jgi:cyclohexadienyl dehydratase